MLKRKTGFVVYFFAVVICVFLSVNIVTAESILKSTNYQLDETTAGSGGLEQSSSNNYTVSGATGDLSVGESSSGNYQIQAGSKTTNDPTLSFNFDNPSANFTDFSPTNASTATATFSISNYTSYGYIVQLFGNPPSNGNHTISAMSTTASSQVGIEQFGINLVANTSPTSVGANPNNGQFGFGSITTNYSTSNKYRYVSGETIAQAPKSSGITVYTISYLVNVASITPGGKYTSNQTLIITGTY